MQLLAYRDLSGRVFVLDQTRALPPLREGYEWTMVIQPDQADAKPQPTPEPAPRPQPSRNQSFLDTVIPIFTPRPGQSPQERAEELIEAIPADVRSKLAQLFNAFIRPALPPFPRG